VSQVEDYYDQNPEREWTRLQRHRTEFAVTMRALQEYLPRPPASILDIGGGPGRYAIALAGQGYTVTLADLSQSCLALARAKAAEAGVDLAGYFHANALDLSRFPQAAYDAVLLMGPLYHLLVVEERWQALREARSVLKPDGLIFASFITRYAPIRDAAKYDPGWVVAHRRRTEELLDTGVLVSVPGSGFTDAYLFTPRRCGRSWRRLVLTLST